MLDIENRLLQDLSWREDELASLKRLYAASPMASPRGKGLRRAYLCMLYAHYEGFSKFAWEEMQIEIARCGQPLSRLRPCVAAQFLSSDISAVRSAQAEVFVDEIADFRRKLMDRVSSTYVAFETSNLWPSVLIEVLEKFGIDTSFIEVHSVALRSLVSRRNDIAHGKNAPVNDRDLEEMHSVTLDVMIGVLISAVDYCENRHYRR